jgi:hypothetical protein
MTRWLSPVPTYKLIETSDGQSFQYHPDHATALPVGDHPGAFGARRKFHRHEGVDLYVRDGTPIFSVESGVVVLADPFTGESASPPSPWWNDTWAIMVEGPSGVVLYGEIIPFVKMDERIVAGQLLGHVTPVLKKDKGRPMSMLHLELYENGIREPKGWSPDDPCPTGLLDPTQKLVECV